MLPKLISSDIDYPYFYKKEVINPWDLHSRVAARKFFEDAVRLTRISDYKLLDSFHRMELHVKTEIDHMRMDIALGPDNIIARTIIQTDKKFEPRRLWQTFSSLARQLRRTELGENFQLTLNQDERQVILYVPNKAAYFAFCDVAQKTKIIEKAIRLPENHPATLYYFAS